MHFLQQPYPFEFNFRKDLLGHLLVGTIIALFLIIFQPFGAWQWKDPYKIFHFCMFGAISFLTSFTTSWIFHTSFKSLEDDWKVWKQLLFIMSFVSLILFFSFLYTLYIGTNTFRLSSFLLFFMYGFFIALIPISVSVFVMYKNYNTLHLKEADRINKKLDEVNPPESLPQPEPPSSQIMFIAENEKDTLTLAGDAILFILSSDNYSEIRHIDGSRVQNTLLRSSLKRLEGQITVPYLQRCHRSAIVNLHKVKHIQGNAQGYKLSFSETDETIPVSRNYAGVILPALESLKKA